MRFISPLFLACSSSCFTCARVFPLFPDISAGANDPPRDSEAISSGDWAADGGALALCASVNLGQPSDMISAAAILNDLDLNIEGMMCFISVQYWRGQRVPF